MPEKHVVLVIDDEESVRDSCAQVLATAGYMCETAPDGASGLERLHRLDPDIVLLDLKMPGLDGLDVLRQAVDTHPATVCIVITGYATIDSAVEAMKHGAFDFLPKPFTPNELRLIVGRALDQRKLLLETQALRQEKDRMTERFITVVAHELRSPLLLVKQHLDLVVGGKSGTLDRVAQETLRDAQGTLDHLLDVIADWLELSKVGTGRIAGWLEEMDLGPLLEKTVEEMAPSARERGVRLILDPLPEMTRVRGNKAALGLAFKNLVSNGINYNKIGGTVRICAEATGGRLSVAVADTGIGIPERDLPFVFDEFFRVRDSKTVATPGTGLGLPIAKRILDEHHGTIEIETKEDEGSTFTARLPLAGRNEEQN